MSLGNYSTLTSGTEKLKLEDFEVEQFNFEKISSKYANKILILKEESKAVSDYDFALKAMYDAGYRIIISVNFPEVFNGKAINFGLFPIEVSSKFMNKMVLEYNNQTRLKLFVDLVGQEVMMVKSGEKEYFKMSEYKKDCLLNGYQDVDYIYCVYDDINCVEKRNCENEITEYALE